MNLATKEAIWLHLLLEKVGEKQMTTTNLFCDNQSTIVLCHNLKYHSWFKHFEVRHHFIKVVARKDLQIIFCGTKNMIANLLTKSLEKIKHLCFKSEVGVHENKNSTSTSSFLEKKVAKYTLGLSNLKFNWVLQ